MCTNGHNLFSQYYELLIELPSLVLQRGGLLNTAFNREIIQKDFHKDGHLYRIVNEKF